MIDKKKLKRTILLTVIGLSAYKYYKPKKNNRRWWVRPSYQLRSKFGFFETTFHRLKYVDCEMFEKAVRMSPKTFDILLNLICFRLNKFSIREPISPECRLFITLMYLAHGGSRQVFAFSFKTGLSTFANVVYETCQTLWDELNEIYLAPPNLTEWENIAKEFENRWKLPNCIGAIDGKHVNIICPPNAGSMFYNFKGRHSTVLLAVCDARYSFTMVDIRAYGSQSDGGILAESSFGKLLFSNKLEIPKSSTLPSSDIRFPYYFVGDNAFPLRQNLMRPFPGNLQPEEENFNKRLSHARVTIENAFGILSSRWRILKTDIHALPSNIDKIVKATVLLHNILIFMKCSSYCPSNYADRIVDNEVIPGEWRNESGYQDLDGLPPSRSHNSSRNAYHLRQTLANYLNHFQ